MNKTQKVIQNLAIPAVWIICTYKLFEERSVFLGMVCAIVGVWYVIYGRTLNWKKILDDYDYF